MPSASTCSSAVTAGGYGRYRVYDQARHGRRRRPVACGPLTPPRPHAMNDSFTQPRQDLHQQLLQLNPVLAGVYRRLIRMLDDPVQPGEEIAQASLIGHALRELMNRFPDVLGDVRGTIARPNPGTRELINDLLRLEPPTEAGPSPDRLAAQQQLIDQLLASSRQETRRGEERDAVAVSAARTRGGPAYDRWRDARAFFMRYVHLNTLFDASAAPDTATVLQHLEVVEDLITIRLAGFTSARADLEELLRDANRNGAGGQPQPPSQEQVEQALRRLSTLSYRRVFYPGLNNPHWVAALTTAGAFARPPMPDDSAEGGRRLDPWPEIDYLVRMAPLTNEVLPVTRALFRNQRHPWIRVGLIEICCALPTSDVAPLVPQIDAWLQEADTWRSDFAEVARLARRLLDAGQTNPGTRLARRLLQPRRRAGVFPNATATVADYAYRDTLQLILPGYPDGGLTIVSGWLRDYLRVSGRSNSKDAADLSSIWRPRIATDTADTDLGDALVDATRDTALTLAATDPEQLEKPLFGPTSSTLHRRIGYFALTAALDTATAPAAAIHMASSLICHRDLLDRGIGAEYGPLLAAISRHRGPAVLEPIAPMLADGPFGSLEALKARISRFDPDEDPDATAERYLRRWRHETLTGIGADALPALLADQLQRLDEQDGPVDDPFPAFVTMAQYHGYESPLSADQMTASPPDQLLRHIAAWQPNPDHRLHDGPSRRGLADALAALVTEDPAHFTGHDALLRTLPPDLQQALLAGWTGAVSAGLRPPDSALTLLQHILETIPDPAGPEDLDRAVTAARLITTWLETDSPHAPTPPQQQRLHHLVAEALGSKPLHEGYAAHPHTSMDAFTLTMNAAYPMLVDAAIALSVTDPEDMSGRLERQLDRVLQQRDPHGAIAAVLGGALGRLLQHHRAWAQDHVAQIFGGPDALERHQQIALSTVLARYYAHPTLLELLRPAFEGALRTETFEPGWRTGRSPQQLLGDWLHDAVVRGLLEPDDPLLEQYRQVHPPAFRGEVLGRLGWRLMHADLDPEPLGRAQQLWDHRVAAARQEPDAGAELAGFFWWVRSDKFHPDWWVPRLNEALRLHPTTTTRGMIGGQLTAAARTHPAGCLAILRHLSAAAIDEYVTVYATLEPAVPAVIAAALDHGDPATQQDARRYMDELGLAGHLDLERLVRDLRRRPDGDSG